MSNNIEFQNRDVLELSQFELSPSLDWSNKSREGAFADFKTAKLPTRKVEHWKYNDMTFLRDNHFQMAIKASDEKCAETIEQDTRIDINNAIEIIFVDGFLSSSLDNLSLSNGVSITSFDNLSPEQQQRINAQVEPELNAKNMLVCLNESINQNGILIEIDSNTQFEKTVYIRHISTVQSSANISSQKVIVNLGTSAEMTLVEQFTAEHQDTDALSLQQTSINLSSNSKVSHYRFNLESESARQVSQVKTTLAQDSSMQSFYLGLGSKLNRTDIDVIYAGQNAECHVTGIYLPANEQAIDYHTNIEHRVPHCNSHEVFRGIIADKASATFNGKIHIFQDAQKSDAQLNNKNLLLTNQAEVNTKPELEIYADDVTCAHGATVAQLDDKAVYYLQTRGINRQKAKKMLSIAFVQELVNTVKQKEIKSYLDKLLDDYMSKIA